MTKITVYQKPTCTTCRKIVKLLNERAVHFDAINYYEKPLSKEKLETLLKKMKMRPVDVLRNKEPIYKELDIKNKEYSDNEIVDLMVKHSDLIQRPIIEKGRKAVLARPIEKIEELLNA